jgi:phosphoglycolate phosphatase-like HAD superfamily hydrolase
MTNRLILWDVDGTLVRGGVVGAAVFDSAIETVLGARPRAQVIFSGKTDRQIVEEFLTMEGTEDLDRVPAVLYHLERELALRVDRIAVEGSACPGSEAALRALAAIDSVEQTVLTGNIAPNALAKLAAFGLDCFLDLEAGAYGNEHSDRRNLLPLAWKHQRELRGVHYLPDETWIVGDTPRDLECARAGGAHCLLVATGRHGFAELEVLGADVVLKDLSDTGVVVGVLTSN